MEVEKMAVQVETYEVGETGFDGESIECDAESIEIMEKLGLDGQLQLVVSDEGEATARIPYRKMTKDEALVFELIFGKKTSLKNFSDEAIPLRVLQVAAHATDIFDQIQVWHKPSADINCLLYTSPSPRD